MQHGFRVCEPWVCAAWSTECEVVPVAWLVASSHAGERDDHQRESGGQGACAADTAVAVTEPDVLAGSTVRHAALMAASAAVWLWCCPMVESACAQLQGAASTGAPVDQRLLTPLELPVSPSHTCPEVPELPCLAATDAQW